MVAYPQIDPAAGEMQEAPDEIQPYKQANHDLAILNKLDIRVKHHELLIAVIGIDGPVGWWGDAEPVNFNFGPYHDGDEVLRFATPDTYGKADVSRDTLASGGRLALRRLIRADRPRPPGPAASRPDHHAL